MNRATHPKRHPDTAYRVVDEEGGLVVVTEKAEVKVLNPAGIKIFSMLDGEHSLEQIADAVVAEFEVEPEQARADVAAFVRDLDSHGMLAGENA